MMPPINWSWGGGGGEVDGVTFSLLVLVGLLLFMFEFNSNISPFIARKLVHLSMGGFILLLLLPEMGRESNEVVRGFVAAVALSSILLCFIRPFRY